MKKEIIIGAVALMLVLMAVGVSAAPKQKCTTIQDGTIKTPEGQLIPMGFITSGLREGYNYQAHLIQYSQQNYKVTTKWNDAYLSNTDCNGDGQLDQHYGYATYQGSGAWLTNRRTATYDQEGKTCIQDSSLRIVAVPNGAYLNEFYWYSADGQLIGKMMGVGLAVTYQEFSDSCTGTEFTITGDKFGLGVWK
jgi:hypothetical protein